MAREFRAARRFGAAWGALVLAFAAPALATTVVSISSGFSIMDIGLTDSGFGGDYDHLEYLGRNTGDIALAPNSPVTVQVNTYIFTAGLNSDVAHTDSGLALDPWKIWITGGVPSPQTVAQTYDIDVNYADTLTVHDGATLTFDLGDQGTLLVTPQGYVTPANSGAAYEAPVNATLELIPVPLPAAAGVGLSMLGGFGALFACRKRLSRRRRIA